VKANSLVKIWPQGTYLMNFKLLELFSHFLLKLGNNKIIIRIRGSLFKRNLNLHLQAFPLVKNVKVGLGPTGVAIAIDIARNLVYITNEKSNTVSVIDGKRNSVVKTTRII
jgi:hypothetical protein